MTRKEVHQSLEACIGNSKQFSGLIFLLSVSSKTHINQIIFWSFLDYLDDPLLTTVYQLLHQSHSHVRIYLFSYTLYTSTHNCFFCLQVLYVVVTSLFSSGIAVGPGQIIRTRKHEVKHIRVGFGCLSITDWICNFGIMGFGSGVNRKPQ